MMFGRKKDQDKEQPSQLPKNIIDEANLARNILNDAKLAEGAIADVMPPSESMRVQDVENFFLYAINPNLIESKIEKETAAQIKERGGIPTSVYIIIVFAIIGAGIAYTMINNQTQLNSANNLYIGCEQRLVGCTPTGVVVGAPTATTTPYVSSGSSGGSPGVSIK